MDGIIRIERTEKGDAQRDVTPVLSGVEGLLFMEIGM